MDAPVVPAQGTAFVTNNKGGKGKKDGKKYLHRNEQNSLSADAKAKELTKAHKKGGLEKWDKDDWSVSSAKSVKPSSLSQRNEGIGETQQEAA